MAAIAPLPTGAAVDFAKDLAPVPGLKSLSCHNPNLSKGEIFKATLSEILDFDEEIIVKGRYTESLLSQVVFTELGNEKPEIPKREKP